MTTAMRYGRVMAQLARYTLAREMAFRGNFLAKVFVEVLWLGFILAFYGAIYQRTDAIAGWTQWQYMFFVGCFFMLNGIVETFFLENCNEFGELVRKGDLDFILIKPIDEQFLVSCRRIDWGTFPNILFGAAIMGYSLWKLDWAFDPVRVAAFVVLFGCGLVLAYGFMMMLTSLSVWLVRNQSLMEMWWLVTSLARYPREIFRATWAEPIGLFLTFVLPFLLIVSVPAGAMVQALEPAMIAYTLAMSVAVFWFSRWFFRRALRSYRSASS